MASNAKRKSCCSRTLVTDQAGKQRITKTNALGQLTDVWEVTAADSATESISFPNQSLSDGYHTTYGYDELGNLINVSQGVQTRTFSYDSLSRLLSATNPESGTVTYTYDANGNLKTKRDARNIKTVFDYDVLNRITKRCYRSIGGGPLGLTTCANNSETPEPNTGDVTYTYENTGITNLKSVLTKVANNLSTTEYVAFDAVGRVARSKQTTDGVVYGDDNASMTYTYALSGALLEQQYPSGRVVRNVFDNDGDFSSVQSKKNPSSGYWNYARSFTYNAAGAVTSTQLGNGRWESTTFNSRLQPTQIALGTTPGATNLLDLDFTYGTTANNGNVLSQTINVPSVGQTNGFTAVQSYSYDSLNRLKDATENITPHGGSQTQSWKQTYQFDRYGNRRFDFTNNGTTTPESSCTETICNPTISTTTNRINSTGYSFDDAGNTTRDASDRKFTYDAENKQVKVESLSPGTNTVTGTIGEYFYDGDGKRVKKYVPSTGEAPVFVYDAVGRLIEEYSTIVALPNDAKVAYLTNDHLGSPRINSDANGAVTARHDYHPFGEEIATSQRHADLGYIDDTVRKQFTGYERDSETELDFAQARFFNYGQGRFSTPDLVAGQRINPQTLNRYVYVINNPMNLVDPSGFCGTTAGSRDGTPCQWYTNKDGHYMSVSKQEFGDGSRYAGYSLVTNREAVYFRLAGTTDDYANDPEYQALAQSNSFVGLGENGRFVGLPGDPVAIVGEEDVEDEVGFSVGVTLSVSGGAGIAFGGGAFEGSYSNLLFITNRGVRYHSFIEGGVAGSFFGQSIGSPQQEGAVVPLGFFGGASVGPTLSNATRGTHIEGKFQTIEAAAGPGSVNIQASPSIWSITPAIGLGSGMGGYGNLTTNTMQLRDVNAAQVIINSVPQKP